RQQRIRRTTCPPPGAATGTWSLSACWLRSSRSKRRSKPGKGRLRAPLPYSEQAAPPARSREGRPQTTAALAKGKAAMRRYFGRKLALYALTFFLAVTIDWLIPRLMPGDPIRTMLARAGLRAEASV